MGIHLTGARSGLGPGRTELLRIDGSDAGIGLDVLRLAAGERLAWTTERETAWILIDGELDLVIGTQRARWSRRSLFDERPSCAHVSAGTPIALEARSDVELTEHSVASTRSFAPTLHAPESVREEHRGAGQVGGACHRLVRTIFDRTTADPSADLVLGEVVTLPGRWSSYPPHHHAQPEIYHYRFTAPQGYGHAELGDRVLKVKQNDTVVILPPDDHAQAAAPGYGMYYSWTIRHLPGQPYDAPTFTEEHRWVMEPGAKHWSPEGMP